ncbi:alanine racemase [Lutimonas halocynthiae]|uniref:alanine racemase n=1 Tax=Lutimonas halocynthiae TaxID=1446477 RepID=UPI0025B321A3|nr:alanine racemase [Lutimonas halocynthiae]MDN3641354.1 alanine racemase [Lutimonas halocynthiae]
MNNNPTVLEIDLSAIEHNLNFFRSKLHKATKVLAVVKASAYGSDPLILSNFLEQQHVDYFAVAYADEGITLRKAGIKTPILVLHPQINNLELLIEYNLEPNLYSKKIFLYFLDLANRLKLTAYPMHLKFNTGLNRLGFKSSDTDFLLEQLKNQDSVYLYSIFSHLVASEDCNEKEYSINQIKEFKSISDSLVSVLGYRPVMHMSNTSGIINYPEAHFDMVRLGLGLFGFTNDPKLNSNLKNVLSLKTVISQIHQVDIGESVGYNRGFISQKEMKTATLPIGHADGFFRSFGQGRASVEVNGQKAPIIGNVCMDMVMIDVSNIQCEEGDQVIIFDSQQDILDLANAASTISYEILTSFTNRIKRISI